MIESLNLREKIYYLIANFFNKLGIFIDNVKKK